MIKIAAMHPRERSMTIQDWRTTLDYDNQPKIAAWGLQVSGSYMLTWLHTKGTKKSEI